MQIVDLFSGLGGFSLAGDIVGWKTVVFVENNPFCQKVLEKHWPGVPIFGDIKQFTINELKKTRWNPSEPTIVVGGFPCQPFSVAGKRKGAEDDRFLWPEMRRVVAEVKPAWVVAENVRGLINQGGGLVFEQVLSDLEALGYETQAFVIPACAVNAPHRRDRVWIVAHAKHDGNIKESGKIFGNQEKEKALEAQRDEIHESEQSIGIRDVAHAINTGSQKRWSENNGKMHECIGEGEKTAFIGAEIAKSNCDVANSSVGDDRTNIGESEKRQIQQFGISNESDIIANTAEQGLPKSGLAGIGELQAQTGEGLDDRPKFNDSHASDTTGERLSRSLGNGELERERSSVNIKKSNNGESHSWTENWIEVATRLCRVDDGIPAGLDEIGGISAKSEKKVKTSAGRVHRLQALGNAVVPKLVVEIYKIIDMVGDLQL